jgi:outer membrane protein
MKTGAGRTTNNLRRERIEAMKSDHFRPVQVAAVLLLTPMLWTWFHLGTAAVARAELSPEMIRGVIEARFPGATIIETREEPREGGTVTEVEFKLPEGGLYEATLSESGDVLNVEAEKGLPLIGGELSLGFGLRGEQSVYRDTDAEYQPVPFLRYENGPFELRAWEGIEALLRLYGTEEYAIGLLGTVDFEAGYDPDDSDFLDGMDELKTLYQLGLELGASIAGVDASLSFLQDVSSEHEGQEVELAVQYPWTMLGLYWQPELSLTWMSARAVDYFYGVSNREARANRPAYDPGSSYEFGFELMIQRPLVGGLSLVGIGEVATFGSEITDSPLVAEDYELEGVLGLMYSF